jgi:hypothetical protein
VIRTLILTVAIAVAPVIVQANARITVLMDLLSVPDVIEILREEGYASAASLERNFLNGQGGAFWAGQLRQIYATDPISEQLRASLKAGLDPEQTEAAIAFFATDAGQQIISLENAARRAMADETVEDAARARFTEAESSGEAQAERVRTFMEVNDLLERNVSGAMSANMQFYTGLADGGLAEQTEDEIIAEVWSDQDAIRTDTEGWLGGFLYMAYQPLPADVLQSYVDFSATEAGQALNAALFDGFNAIYRDVSYALGRAVALNASGDEI